MTEGKLVASVNRHGRYAVGSPDRPDLVSNQAVSIQLNGSWIHGYVQAAYVYVVGRDIEHGYYFASADNLTRCGLCLGMQSRLKG